MTRSLCDERYPAEAGSCALSRWSGDVMRCRWCDRSARPGSPWCGHLCEDEYRRNHWWDHARHAAVVRDGDRCVRCGLGPATLTLARLLLRALVPLGEVDAARLVQSRPWQDFRQACTLEVNHVVPRRGGGYDAGCHNHLSGLETLCHRCHLEVTADQQRAQRAGRWAEAG